LAERTGLLVVFLFLLLVTMVAAVLFLITYGEEAQIMGGVERTWSYGGFSQTEIPLQDDTERVVIEVEVESDHQFDVYLVGEEPGGTDFILGDPETVRQGVAGNGSTVEWEVNRDDFGPDGLIFILDNTDTGEVPLAPEGTAYQETIHITSYRSIFAYPVVWLLVVFAISTVMVGVYTVWLARNEPDEFTQNPESFSPRGGAHRPGG
jgi:hypothetical protein